MKMNNSIMSAAPQKKQTFSAAVNSQAMQGMISRALNDPRRAANFTSTLISIVGSSEQLQQCEPSSIVSAALRGEGMDLSLALGQFSVVPYGTNANYQISYKGLSQLAMRSGMYADFDAFDVREGEYKGKNPRTRQPVIEWIEDEDEREQKPLAGIYAFYELKNGFFKSIYWTHEKILLHADRYSQAFSKAKYDKLLNGELSPDDVKKLQRGTPWYGDPLSETHLTMCKKTLILRLLGDGKAPLSIEMRTAIDHEVEQERSGEIIFANDATVVDANKYQGDVVNSTATVEPVEQRATPPVESGARRTRSTLAEQKQSKARTAATSAENSSKSAQRREAAQTSDEAHNGMPLEEFMTPPVSAEGLPFA